MLRRARASTNAPSSAHSRRIASSRARAAREAGLGSAAVAAAVQLSNTSAHARRMGSLVLETSSAIVAIGHASA